MTEKRNLKQVKSGKSNDEESNPLPESEGLSKTEEESSLESKSDPSSDLTPKEKSELIIRVKYTSSTGQDIQVQKDLRVMMVNGGVYEVDGNLPLVKGMLANKTFVKVQDDVPVSEKKISETIKG